MTKHKYGKCCPELDLCTLENENSEKNGCHLRHAQPEQLAFIKLHKPVKNMGPSWKKLLSEVELFHCKSKCNLASNCMDDFNSHINMGTITMEKNGIGPEETL